jgi:hypothetical protein
MWIRRIAVGLFAALVLALVGGCKKSNSDEKNQTEAQRPSAQSSAPTGELIARIHWLGKKRISAEPGSAYFMSILNLPESLKLESQTLDRLSMAPIVWLSPGTNRITARATNSFLRPLYDDLVMEESYLESRLVNTQNVNSALAIHLDAQRAALWEKNIAGAFQSFSKGPVVAGQAGTKAWDFQLKDKSPEAVRHLEMAQAGDWTVIGFGQEPNGVFSELLARIQREKAPVPATKTNFWLDAQVDLKVVALAAGQNWELPTGIPKVSLTMIGEGDNARSRAEIEFPNPLPFDVQPWYIPTNLVHDPLVSFTAWQGLKPLISAWKPWNALPFGPPPNEFYSWAIDGPPLLSYFAFPSVDTTNQIQRLMAYLDQKVNPRAATNDLGEFQASTNSTGIDWSENPFMAPFIDARQAGQREFMLGGLLRLSPTNRPIPGELIQSILTTPNLVGYDWELTEERMKSLLYIGQLFRYVFKKAQLPSDVGSIPWLLAVAPKLGNCTTLVTRTGPNRLSLLRTSSLGFSALELHVMMDWLESPEFPRGLYTFTAPLELPRRKRQKAAVDGPTNSPAAAVTNGIAVTNATASPAPPAPPVPR